MARRIEKIRETLGEIQADRGFHLEERLEDKRSVMSRETHSFVEKDEVIGRNDDKKAIIELLLSDLGTKKNVSTIAIVGIGGLGKTTLAQLIFNDEEVKKCFESKGWVCVSESDVFDVKLLVQKIVTSVGGTSPDPNPALEQLQTQLRSRIEGKKYLLVLDDVWNEKSAEWDKLAKLLQSGATGSRILITTRSEMVATATRTTRAGTYQLRGLDEGKSLDLFRTMAFEEGKQPADNWGLAGIEREIVDKCKGVPLAIKSIATLLQSRLLRSPDPEKEWKLFKESELAEIANEDENDIIPTLRLSYKNLPSHLKHCFAFCRLFPKDHRIDVAKLIRLWIAQGFIKPSENRQLSLEDVGREYFVDLLWRSFFQEARRDEFGNITSCKMHDLIHDLAISVAGKGIITLDKSKDNTQSMGSSGSGTNTKNVHHAYADFGNNGSRQIPEFWLGQNKLRSLALSSVIIPNLDVVVSNFKFLRSLSLIRMMLKILPDKVGELIHLRYLDLSFNGKIKVLPDSITRLHHLETLILEHCEDLERLPQDMKKLVNLRHLELSGCWSLTHTPRGIGELTSLQTLSLFKVVDDDNDQLSSQCARLDELSGLNNLHGELKIKLGHKKDVASESKAAKLKDKEQLQSLYLSWQGIRDVENNEIMENDGMALDGFQPAQTLKALHVQNYMGLRISDWLSSLTRLQSLDIDACPSLVSLPNEIGKLSSLRSLGLSGCSSLVSLPNEIGKLSSLRSLGLSGCSSLVSLPNEIGKLSSLQSLRLSGCSSLVSLPNEIGKLSSLQFLGLSGCSSLVSLPNEMGKLSSLPYLDVRGCSSLVSLPNEIGKLSSLPSLDVGECSSLVSLPNEIGKLSSIPSLDLSGCSNVVSLPNEIGKLSSLQSLGLSGCSSLVSVPNEIGKLSSLRSLGLSGCSSLVSLPNEIGKLSSLRSLGLSGCSSLVSLPNEIGKLSSLRSLDLSGCSSLVSLPNEIGELSSLRSLDLSGCSSLVFMPNEIGELSSLRSLRLSECSSLVSLPNEIGELSSLQSLGLSGSSGLVSLPNEIGELSSLQYLGLSGCSSLVSLPNEIGELSSLWSLDLRGCSSLVSLPNEIDKFSSLRSLDLRGCSSLVSLPNEIGKFSSHRSLDISGCSSLVSLPNEIGKFSSLGSLNLSGCSSLVSLPNEIGKLSSLWSLNLSGCSSLVSLPNEIGKFSSLESLNLNGCSSLVSLPNEIGNLSSLESLHLSGCSSLVSLPNEIDKLSSLDFLDLSGCSSLVSLPNEIGKLSSLDLLDISGCSTICSDFQRLLSYHYLHIIFSS
ncbi:hypothetical protein UlMin_029022 [Ulmus minor]